MAVLLSAGWSAKKALLFQIVSGCTAFIGLYIGILVSEFSDAQEYIFIVAAGMFLYIALADVVRQFNLLKLNNFNFRATVYNENQNMYRKQLMITASFT